MTSYLSRSAQRLSAFSDVLKEANLKLDDLTDAVAHVERHVMGKKPPLTDQDRADLNALRQELDDKKITQEEHAELMRAWGARGSIVGYVKVRWSSLGRTATSLYAGMWLLVPAWTNELKLIPAGARRKERGVAEEDDGAPDPVWGKKPGGWKKGDKERHLIDNAPGVLPALALLADFSAIFNGPTQLLQTQSEPINHKIYASLLGLQQTIFNTCLEETDNPLKSIAPPCAHPHTLECA